MKHYSKKLQEAILRRTAGRARELFQEQLMDMRVDRFIEEYGMADFTALTVDAAHVRARAAYDKVPTTWEKIVSVGPGASDFKTQHVVQAGELPYLELVKAHSPYPLAKFSDDDVTYTVAKYGQMGSVSLEARMSDATGTLIRWAQKQARAAGRTIERFVVKTNLEDNPSIYDGNTLFHADHNNDVGTAGGYSRAALIEALATMRKQTEPDGSQFPVMGKYVLVDPDHELEAMEDVASATKIAIEQATSTNVQAGAMNAIAQMNLEVLCSPWLTSGAFYVIADPASFEGFTLDFLRNQRRPELFVEDPNSGDNFERDAVRTKVRHVYGGAWTDWRGIARNGV